MLIGYRVMSWAWAWAWGGLDFPQRILFIGKLRKIDLKFNVFWFVAIAVSGVLGQIFAESIMGLSISYWWQKLLIASCAGLILYVVYRAVSKALLNNLGAEAKQITLISSPILWVPLIISVVGFVYYSVVA